MTSFTCSPRIVLTNALRCLVVGGIPGLGSMKPTAQLAVIPLLLEEVPQPAMFVEQGELLKIILLGQGFTHHGHAQALAKGLIASLEGGLLVGAQFEQFVADQS